MSDSEEALRWNPLTRGTSALTILMIINVLVWIVWQFSRSSAPLGVFMRDHFQASHSGVFENFYIHTLFTSTISHIEPGHLVFNMLFFWFLGRDVEQIYGFRNFFVLYAFTGVLASLTQIGLDALPLGPKRVPGDISFLGASGAIMGVAVVAAIFDPERPMSIYGLIPIKLKWLVLIYSLTNVAGIFYHPENTGLIANGAHLGGALAGYLFWKLDVRVFPSPGRSRVGLLYRIQAWFRREPRWHRLGAPGKDDFPREPVAKRRASIRAALGSAASQRPASHGVDAVTAQKVDELLGKISRQGMGALTDEENAFLRESSKKYKAPKEKDRE